MTRTWKARTWKGKAGSILCGCPRGKSGTTDIVRFMFLYLSLPAFVPIPNYFLPFHFLLSSFPSSSLNNCHSLFFPWNSSVANEKGGGAWGGFGKSPMRWRLTPSRGVGCAAMCKPVAHVNRIYRVGHKLLLTGLFHTPLLHHRQVCAALMRLSRIRLSGCPVPSVQSTESHPDDNSRENQSTLSWKTRISACTGSKQICQVMGMPHIPGLDLPKFLDWHVHFEGT